MALHAHFDKSKYFLFNTFFWETLSNTEQHMWSLRRINEHMSIESCANFENCDVFVIPILFGPHWLLATISKSEMKIRIYDSRSDADLYRNQIKRTITKFLMVS